MLERMNPATKHGHVTILKCPRVREINSRTNSPRIRFSHPVNLSGMVKTVPRVNVQRLGQRVGLVGFGMVKRFEEVCFRHRLKEPFPAGMQASQQSDRQFRVGVRVDRFGPCRLVVRPDRRILFGERQLETNKRVHVAISQVADDLP